MTRLALVLVAAAVLAPQAEAARYAIGVATPADLPRLRAALPGSESLAPIPALVVERATPPRLRDLPGATYVERLGTRRRGVRPERPARRPAVASRVQPDVRLLGDADAARVGPGCGDRLRHRRRASRLRRQDRRFEDIRRRLGPRRRGGARDVRRRLDRRRRQQLGRDRRLRLLRRAPRREGRRRQRPDRRRGRGEGDQMGRRPRRARDQHEPGRLPRPARPRPGCVLAARGAGDRLGARQGRRRRRGGRQQHGHAAAAVAVRELSGGASARARRQRARPRRLRARLLAPGQDLHRHRRAGRRHPLDLPAGSDRRDEGVRGAGLLQLRQ